jgi:predicted helicase
MQSSFGKILDKYRKISFSEKDKSERFERLMKANLFTEPKYAAKFKKKWLWGEFPSKNDLIGHEIPDINYKIQKMRFPKKNQKDPIIYNNQKTLTNIPDVAFQYVINGKSAIEWIMERYQIATDSKSGITNNSNDWSAEVGIPHYVLDLLLSIINVSVQTVEIVEKLPKITFDDKIK